MEVLEQISTRQGTAMAIVIRDALLADLPAIVDIYNAAIPTRTAAADLEPVSVDSRRDWFAQHSPDSRPLWVLEVNGEIAAWICLSSFYNGRPAYQSTAEISIYISPKHQRKGYGSLLVQRLIEHCPRLGITMLVATFFDHNSGSRRMFESLGFRQMGHLIEVADLDGVKRGLIITTLKV